MATIDSFKGKYAFLSNFYDHPITYNGKVYPTSEHAYQAAKVKDHDLHELVRKASSPGMSKRLGNRYIDRTDFHSKKIDIMHDILVAKFSDPQLKQMLIGTGDADLIEGNTWNDTFWGVCRGVGTNHLGLLLMQVREEISG